MSLFLVARKLALYVSGKNFSLALVMRLFSGSRAFLSCCCCCGLSFSLPGYWRMFRHELEQRSKPSGREKKTKKFVYFSSFYSLNRSILTSGVGYDYHGNELPNEEEPKITYKKDGKKKKLSDIKLNKAEMEEV